MKTTFNNILVIRQSALGDVVNIFPVLKLLRKEYPAAKITCLTGSLTADLLQDAPEVDKILVFNRTKRPFVLLPMLSKLRSLHFELVIDLQSSKHSRWLTWATLAPVRMGHGKRFFYTHPARYDAAEGPACDSFLKILAPLEFADPIIEPYFPDLPRAEEQAKTLIANFGLANPSIVVLNPGHSPEWITKRWPLPHWVELAKRFIARGMTPIITGGPGEIGVAEDISAATNGQAVATAGKTSLKELAGIMALAKVVVSTDSGPMHVAAMAGAPVVALFGPTNPVPSAPFGDRHRILHRQLDCSLCFKKQCSFNHECLDQLMPEAVWREVETVLNR